MGEVVRHACGSVAGGLAAVSSSDSFAPGGGPATCFGGAWGKTVQQVLPHLCGSIFFVLLLLQLQGLITSWRGVFAPLYVADAVCVSRRAREARLAWHRWLRFRRGEDEDEEDGSSQPWTWEASLAAALRPWAYLADTAGVVLTKAAICERLEGGAFGLVRVTVLMGPFWAGTLLSSVIRGIVAGLRSVHESGQRDTTSHVLLARDPTTFHADHHHHHHHHHHHVAADPSRPVSPPASTDRPLGPSSSSSSSSSGVQVVPHEPTVHDGGGREEANTGSIIMTGGAPPRPEDEDDDDNDDEDDDDDPSVNMMLRMMEDAAMDSSEHLGQGRREDDATTTSPLSREDNNTIAASMMEAVPLEGDAGSLEGGDVGSSSSSFSAPPHDSLAVGSRTLAANRDDADGGSSSTSSLAAAVAVATPLTVRRRRRSNRRRVGASEEPPPPHSSNNNNSASSPRVGECTRRVVLTPVICVLAAHVVCRALQPALIAAKLDGLLGADTRWAIVFAPAWGVLAVFVCVATTLCNCAPLLSGGMPARVRRRAVRLVTLCALQLLVLAACTFFFVLSLSRRLDAEESARRRYHDQLDRRGCGSDDFLLLNATQMIATRALCDSMSRRAEGAPTVSAILVPVIVMYCVLFVLHPLVLRDSRRFQQVVQIVVIEADDGLLDARDALAQQQRAGVFDLFSGQRSMIGVEDDSVLVEALTMPTRLLKHSSTLYGRATVQPYDEETGLQLAELSKQNKDHTRADANAERAAPTAAATTTTTTTTQPNTKPPTTTTITTTITTGAPSNPPPSYDEKEHYEEEPTPRRRSRASHAANNFDDDATSVASAGSSIFDDGTPRRAATPPPPTTIPQSQLCYVCCIERRNAVIMECGHGGLCFDCGKSLATRHPRTCPICRGPITSVLKVERRKRGENEVISREGVRVHHRTAQSMPPSPTPPPNDTNDHHHPTQQHQQPQQPQQENNRRTELSSHQLPPSHPSNNGQPLARPL